MSSFGQPPGGGFGPPGGSPPGGFGDPPAAGFGAPPGGGFGPGGNGSGPGGFGPPGPPMRSGPQLYPFAIASLVTSMLSLVTCFCCGALGGVFGTGLGGVPVGLIGIGLGVFSTMQINKEPDRLSGKGFAIAGIAVGAVSIVVTLLLIVLVLVGAVAMPQAR